jgi:hypothetical protein
MRDSQTENSYKPGHVIVRAGIGCVVLIALYLAGFIVTSYFGPALRPPASAMLEFVYWPLLKCDQNDIEPFNSVIEWMRHRGH